MGYKKFFLIDSQHNDIIVLMLPQIDMNTGYLPPGVHGALWAEVELWFGTNDYRKQLLIGLQSALVNLAEASCRSVLINGSFISAKPDPADYDGAWDPCGVNFKRLDPVLLDFSNARAAMKAKFGGELFLATGLADPDKKITFRDFFQTDRDGVRKGIIEIDPRRDLI
ncbi:MAG: hypothetical protein OXF09_01475 [Hyphomicrobiales bacterium]|nr:hypothetical protein [Hyphomicrobiales bacterium]